MRNQQSLLESVCQLENSMRSRRGLITMVTLAEFVKSCRSPRIVIGPQARQRLNHDFLIV